MKLDFEIVPDGCWYSNLRTLLPKSHWDAIRRRAYANANGKCTICNRNATRLEAHERWAYDIDSETQKLINIIAVCHQCHSVIHIGRTQLLGDENQAIKHFCYVNNCTYSDYIKALSKANQQHQQQNKVSEWKLDLSFLETFF